MGPIASLRSHSWRGSIAKLASIALVAIGTSISPFDRGIGHPHDLQLRAVRDDEIRKFETRVAAGDRHSLVTMLYAHLLTQLARAADAIDARSLRTCGDAASQVLLILAGLTSSLDLEPGDRITAHLGEIYARSRSCPTAWCSLLELPPISASV